MVTITERTVTGMAITAGKRQGWPLRILQLFRAIILISKVQIITVTEFAPYTNK